LRMPLLGRAEVGAMCDEFAKRAGDDILMAAGVLARKRPQVGLILRYRAMTNMKAP
jgi:hypothetical protein